MVVPEYNHSFPGEWKLAIDALSGEVCAGKRVFLVSVSAGSFAGVRVAEQVQPVLHTLGFVLEQPKLHVSKVGNNYPADGPVEPDARERLEAFVAALLDS